MGTVRFLPATLPATAVTLGPTAWTMWTTTARETNPECPRVPLWTAPRQTFNPRVLGSNPSRLTTFRAHMSVDTYVLVDRCEL